MTAVTGTPARRSASTSRPVHISASAPPLSSSPAASRLPPPATRASSPSSSSTAPSPWWVDRRPLALLVMLYVAQGLPMGLAFGSIPLLLKEQAASYSDLARFSLVGLPYSLKLFVAPIVDSLYFPRFGRRRSWIVPVQLAIGTILLLAASRIHASVMQPAVHTLVPIFIVVMTLVAIQDIAVDGWSLTLLQKHNLSLASTCQSLGMSLGFFMTFTIFLAFSNAAFCDMYVRPLLPWLRAGAGAFVDLHHILRLVAVFYLALTTFVALCCREVERDDVTSKKADDESAVQYADQAASPLYLSSSQITTAITSTYSQLLHIVKLPAVRSLLLCLIIARVPFSTYDNVVVLKLLELGFTKEQMASMAVFQTPVSLIGTVMTGRLVAKRSATRVYLIGWLLRFVLHLLAPPFISVLKTSNGQISSSTYFLTLGVSLAYNVASDCLMFVALGAFFVQVTSTSVSVAGSYLTLLNTMSNMGYVWHKALCLWLVDRLTVRDWECTETDVSKCDIVFDGYFVMSGALLPVGVLVGLYLLRALPRLERLPAVAWQSAPR